MDTKCVTLAVFFLHCRNPWGIVMGNVRYLPNKMDGLAVLTRYERHYRQSITMLFTDTWLTSITLDEVTVLDDFNVTIKGQQCCRDCEVLGLSRRPSNVITLAAYVLLMQPVMSSILW